MAMSRSRDGTSRWWHGGDVESIPKMREGDEIEIVVFDDNGDRQGRAVVRVDTKYKAERHGVPFLGTFLAASDSYFRWWFMNKLPLGPVLLHLCVSGEVPMAMPAAQDCSGCRFEDKKAEFDFHVDEFRILSPARARELVRVWTSSASQDFTDFRSVSPDGRDDVRSRRRSVHECHSRSPRVRFANPVAEISQFRLNDPVENNVSLSDSDSESHIPAVGRRRTRRPASGESGRLAQKDPSVEEALDAELSCMVKGAASPGIPAEPVPGTGVGGPASVANFEHRLGALKRRLGDRGAEDLPTSAQTCVARPGLGRRA
jgi:hypothetical protein